MATDLAFGNTTISASIPSSGQPFSGHLQQLQLHSTRISCTIPPVLFQMQNLFHFAIFDTNISGTLPTEWPHVTHLHCHKTPLSGTISYPIESVRTESETFFLRETALSGSLPALYNIGESLQIFDVSSTRISGSLSSSSSTCSTCGHTLTNPMITSRV